ncbi:MAG TPA: NAD(P)/FAD-dependent oxidoreductase [Solirubrobacteraceae bacterium]|jgi:2,4-dienoyl-CoA reductase-like NADH-dependent reductase (Old Yellow Enzyme family)/thioredoxin reductase
MPAPETVASDPLLEPLQIGPLRLKNRIVMPPMGTGLDDEGQMNDAAIEYYRRRAAGGVGMVIVEALLVDPATEGPEPRIDRQSCLAGLGRLVDALRPFDVAVGAQLLHPGRQVLSGRLVGPSPIPLNSVSPQPHELTIAEIEQIVDYFADAAALAQQAGFHFVEIHGAHGYLPSDFLSPLANVRQDGYGGDVERRARFPREIVRAIVARCGEGLPVFYRINGDEALKGGSTVDDAIAVSRLLVDDGAACISVTAGNWRSLHVTLAPMFLQRGHLLDIAREVRSAVSAPVIAVGRLDDPDDARRALQTGAADLVAIGRGLIAEPEWASKVAAGRAEEIRPCIACNACVELVGSGGEIRCAVNPEVGHEHLWRIEKTARPRRVAIVGSGPAGMEAARVARLRGHAVSLWDSGERLGGKLEAAASAPSKSEVLRFRDYEARTLQRLGVQVHLGVSVTKAVIEAEDPDVVVLATGADALMPPIPGLDGEGVHDAQALLLGEVPIRAGEHVAVIGGSATGCETAELLLARGAEVTMLEMAGSIGNGIEPITRRHLLRELRSAGAKLLSGARVTAVQPGAVVYLLGDEERSLRVDKVAVAVGWRPRGAELREALGEREVVLVGDALRPADFVAAVNAGAEAALKL